jgi:hypothetical protein
MRSELVIYSADIMYRTIMRILVDLPDADLAALSSLSRGGKPSRAALIRAAVSEYLERHSASPLDEAFGLWVQDTADGLEYQRKLRSEW